MDAATIATQLEKTWLAGQRDSHLSELRELIAAIAEDWARQLADCAPIEPQKLFDELYGDLEAQRKKLSLNQRLEKLREIVWQRRAMDLSSRVFELAKSVMDGRVPDDEAKAQAQKMLDEMGEIQKHLNTPETAEQFSDSFMDITYILHRKAMSIRLGMYQRAKK